MHDITEIPEYTYPSVAGKFVSFYTTSFTISTVNFTRALGLYVEFNWTYGKV